MISLYDQAGLKAKDTMRIFLAILYNTRELHKQI